MNEPSRLPRAPDGATIEALPGSVYRVVVNTKISPALAAEVDRIIVAHHGDTNFGVVLETGPDYGGYDPAMRSPTQARLSGLAAALVTQRATLRMVVATVTLMLPKSAVKIRPFEDRDEAVAWVRRQVRDAIRGRGGLEPD